jgi:CubicO group peptidase (beta-lactamase class C family)
LFQTRNDWPSIHGWVARGFELVRTAFIRNFTERGEVGAACAIYHKGAKVVDLWGGFRDVRFGDPWEEDTMVTVFSTSKGMAAMAMAVAHSRGLFQLDEPVATYWPEFAQQGKERITVRQLLAHQAGLPAVDEALDVQKMADLDFLADVLARQRPAWTPGTRHGYHGLTLGFYQNELIRRVDPARRTLGQFLRDEITAPLGIEFYIGLPSDIATTRLASLEALNPLRLFSMLPSRMVLTMIWPRSLATRSLWNPKMLSIGEMASRAYRTIEIPSANGVGQARAIAHAYGVFAMGGGQLGITPETMGELTRPPTDPTLGCDDLILFLDTRYSCGFWKPCSTFPFGTSEKAFGAMGVGGSAGFADPDAKLGFAYVTNKMGFHLVDDPREKALRSACYASLAYAV